MVGNVFGFLFVWLKRGEGCTLQCVSMNVQCVSMNVLLLQQCGSLSGLWPEFQRKTCAETFWGSSLGHPLRCCQSHHLVGMVRYRVVSGHTDVHCVVVSLTTWSAWKDTVLSLDTLASTALLSISPLGRHGKILCCLWTHWHQLCCCQSHHLVSMVRYCVVSGHTGMHCVVINLSTWSAW